MKFLYITASTLLLMASCKSTEMSESKPEPMGAANLKKRKSIELSYMDKSVKPQDDFFQFANGTWVKNNPVPASESRWGSFNELDQSNKKKLTEILEGVKNTKAVNGSPQQILGHYYASMTNMESRNNAGIRPIREQLSKIHNIQSKDQLSSIIGEMHQLGINALFSFGVGQDLKNVDENIVYFSQGGVGLPNKNYYFDEDKESIRNSYLNHIRDVLSVVFNDKDKAAKMSIAIMEFEKNMAQPMMEPSELRSPEATYNKFSKKSFVENHKFDFENYLKTVGVEDFDSLVVGQPRVYKYINTLIEKTDLEKWKSYLTWKVVNHYAGHLDDKLVALNFNFYGGVLRGKSEMKPINERAINEITNSPFAELLGKMFVARHFSDAAKERVNSMVDNLTVVYRERIENLEWMSKETKKKALEKLNAINRKLGFPDKTDDYSTLAITPDNYIKNINASAIFAHKRNLEKLNKPVDKTKWEMPAHMVNAYYHPLINEIVFPAGIMQEPFFSEEYEDAMNYGAIGMVIGHEFTHGFDDMGSKFAADGSFTNWWTKDDRKSFEERTEKLGNTFSHFCPVEGYCVNPDLTMGENIADLGGLTMAYHAYAMTDEFKSGKIVNGYTPAQRFFIAYAQLWKINYTEAELKNRIANDSHSPGMYRVNGPLMNCPEFFEAFNVQEGDKMRNPKDKISKIW